MKTLFKSIAICLVAVFILGVFSACAPSPQEVAGTYTGTYEYNGNIISVTMTLGVSEYSKITLKNGSISAQESGDYEIKGNKIILYDASSIVYHGMSTPYKYKDGVMENNGHKFYKTN